MSLHYCDILIFYIPLFFLHLLHHLLPRPRKLTVNVRSTKRCTIVDICSVVKELLLYLKIHLLEDIPSVQGKVELAKSETLMKRSNNKADNMD